VAITTSIGEEVKGLKAEGYSIVYSGRLATYGNNTWVFTRHNQSKGTSDILYWNLSKKEIRVHTETGMLLWHVKVLASEIDFIRYEILY
jgi:hypothetical protein